MAQNTAGIWLVYQVIERGVWEDASYQASLDMAAPSGTWTHIPGIVSFPSMNASPESLDATTTDELVYKTYISGLMDLGGSLEFTANLTPELEATIDAIIVSQADADYVTVFGIEYPNPLNEIYWWKGNIQAITPGEVGVNQVLQTTLYISQETGPRRGDGNNR